MKSKSNITLRHFHTISDMMCAFGLPKPLHPLICLLDYDQVQLTDEMLSTNFAMDFYNITYNETPGCRMRYGRTTYDFNDAGMSFTAPGQILLSMKSVDPSISRGFTLLVHPDFLRQYPLDAKMKNFGFFSYAVTESLHLSDKEKNIVTTIANIINDELKTSIDDLSQDVLVSQLELILNYSQRFYKRQFITRKTTNNDLLNQLDHLINQYFDNNNALTLGLPTVQHLADELKVSTRYLSDMLRMYIGHNTQQHIHEKLIEKAKEKLSISNSTISEIAYELGFEHPPSFSKLFKKFTNISPLEFRQSFN